MSTRDRILDAAQRRVIAGGFAATTIDVILADVGVSKGAFFHHFPSKSALGTALVRRYADRDLALLDEFLAQAEADTDDPALQITGVLSRYEGLVSEIDDPQPGCLFVSFIFDLVPETSEIHEIIAETVQAWRTRFLERLRAAAERHTPQVEVDLPSLADQVFTVFEGGFILIRATGDRDALRAQLAHLRRYIELVFDL